MKTALSAKIGKKIKEKRLELKLTIHEISNEINLTEKFLKAIENGDYSIFPAKTFARGYFVKYTTHLGLDLEFPELANEVFEEDKLAQPNQSAKHVKAKSINDVIESYKKPLLVAGIILFLLLIVSVLARSSSDVSQIKSSSDEETIEINSIPSFSQIDDTPTDIEVPEGLIMESNNTEISVVSTDSSTDEINQPKDTPKNLLNLNFNEESWVEIYSADPSDYFQVVYKLFNENETYQLQVESPLVVVVGNASGVVGTFNDLPLDFSANANRLDVSVIRLSNG
jgi:cytoskeletal protein RodZ